MWVSASRWTRLGGGVTAPGPPPGRGAGRPGSHLASPRGPAPVTPASRSDRGGRREAAWAPRGRLFTPGLTRPLWDSQGCRSKGPQSGRGAADSRGSFSRSGGWERGLKDQVLPRRGPAVPPPAEGGAGGPGSARLWLRDSHPCLHRRVASLPLGKVSVLRPPPLRRTRSPGEGPSHLQRPPFQKRYLHGHQELRLKRIFWQT